MYGPKVRCRWQVRPGHWAVRARVERLIEPAVLLLLRDRPRHGYDLLENIPGLVGDDGDVDLGNLYRMLRGLEAEGVVSSTWHVDVPGPAGGTGDAGGQWRHHTLASSHGGSGTGCQSTSPSSPTKPGMFSNRS